LSFSLAELKNACARWATGVTIVTARAGDHIIYVGEVDGLHLSDGEPLLFYNRGYCGLAE